MLENVVPILANDLDKFISTPNTFRSLIILLVSLVVAFWLSKIIARFIIKVAQAVALRSDNSVNEERTVQLRRIETYLSITVALVRTFVVIVVAYVFWSTFSPLGDSSVATIGASALFIVLAGATIGTILRDVTAGSTMIAEDWFNVGDFIRVEPFVEVGGVVERITLRSTKMRSLNGEVIWLHNQHIHGVKVTPRGLRSIAVDFFVNDRDAGEKHINNIIKTIPTSKMMIARPIKITSIEQWGEGLWRLVAFGQTPPGREWLIEDYFVTAVIEASSKKKVGFLAHKPLVRYADAEAEKKFKRAVRLGKE